MSQWIKCSDKLPNNFATVLIVANKKVYPGFYNCNIKEWLLWTGWSGDRSLVIDKPSYWKELPKPPELPE